MKKNLYILLLLIPVLSWGQVKTDRPVKEGKTSFAIVTDSRTYSYCKDALINYRNAVEQDGLGTYILHADWKDPMQIRQELSKLYKSDSHLEGIVLVGDIPIAMIRNAQHLTTAFKMNEKKYPYEESSVPSDRFYDDLHLTFDYLCKDKNNTSYFYYKLREDSPQRLSPSFYSARIKYPEAKGGNKYKAISDFLNKAANAKKETNNQLDHIVSFTGSAYNSECLVAWMDEEKAYHENFPLAWKNNSCFKHYNFRLNETMKFSLMDELQRPEVDLFMFHEHGLPNMQVVNDEPVGDSFKSRYEIMQKELYENTRLKLKKGIPLDSIKSEYIREYHLLPSFFDKLEDKTLIEKDSLTAYNCFIHLSELAQIRTYPKMVMLDACYNGSFHLNNYVAGYYLFNGGNTLVVQGNTLNVLQDRWTTEMIGLLSHGLRVGQYNQLIATLEGHLLGDPTVHFAPIKKGCTLAYDIKLKAGQAAYWEALLNSPFADIHCLAMRMLCDYNKKSPAISGLLLKNFKESSQNVVRMEALKLLSRYRNQDFYEAVRMGLHDPYEFIARASAVYSGKIGDEGLLYSMLDAYINEGERQRVAYNLNIALKTFPQSKVIEVAKQVVKSSNRVNDETSILTKMFLSTQKYQDKSLTILMDKKAASPLRIEKIRELRNNTCHYWVDDLLKVLSDTSELDEVRINVAEALGWFDLSIWRKEILATCDSLLQKEKLSNELKDELIQTINRLK